MTFSHAQAGIFLTKPKLLTASHANANKVFIFCATLQDTYNMGMVLG